MKPTDLLKEEHLGVKLSLRVLERICLKLSEEPDVDREVYVDDLRQLIDFFQIFIDKCHHAKEEEIFFPALITAGLPKDDGLVQVLLHEHEDGRKLVAEMIMALENLRAITRKDWDSFIETANSYNQLLTDHIAKEDNVLYPLADSKLSDTIQAEMVEAFEKIEIERIGQGRHEQFHSMLKEFNKKYLK